MIVDQMINHKFFKELPKENILFSEPLMKHTFTKVGGKADIFIMPSNIIELQSAIITAKQFNIPVTILGNGSNVIVKDGGLRGITLCLRKLHDIHVKGNVILAQSGAAIIDVSQQALEFELSGLEFACGIPGTVGGALYMNAGAYGGQISDILESATILTGDGEIQTLSKSELLLGYRQSIFKDKGYVILEANFKLEKSVAKLIKDKMDELTIARRTKQPLEYPSCGSVFKRPPGYYAGKLIQDCGLQGKRIGGAEVSKKHAGFIVNVENATSQDYLNLIGFVQQTVKEKFGVDLETEVIILGDD